MGDAVDSFHPSNDVSLFGRTGQKAKGEPNALSMELFKKGKVDEETNGETRTASKKQCEMNAGWDYCSHEIEVTNE